MSHYSAHWRFTILAAILLHMVACLAFSLIQPHLSPMHKSQETAEMAWVDVDLVEESSVTEEGVTASNATASTSARYEFPPIVMPPDIPIESTNTAPYIEETREPPPLPKRVELPQRQPVLTKDEEEVLNGLERSSSAPSDVATVADVANTVGTANITDNPQGKQEMAEPPVTVNAYYPPEASGLDYNGYVAVAATIDTSGRVKEVKIVLSSGVELVDNIALKAARKWTFKPALDTNGKLMECDKIITFDFKDFS